MKTYFITSIDTDMGKTVASAILTELLEADYWKPIQTGQDKDTNTLKNLISNKNTVFFPETYALKNPISPHEAAAQEKVRIKLESIKVPATHNHLIIEGAGGIMTPLNDAEVLLDLIQKINVEVILVVKNYLGSLNHTLLTISKLKTANIRIKGIIFNGLENPASESYILTYTKLECLGRIAQHQEITKKEVLEYKTNGKIKI